jgi:hypothetical protein
MFEIIGLAATVIASGYGYFQSRQFVRTKLRFVDAIQKPSTPIIAGAAAAAVAAPVVWLLPLVGAGTALLFGAGVGVGVHHGAKDARKLPGF